jgi:hypothetical protein
MARLSIQLIRTVRGQSTYTPAETSTQRLTQAGVTLGTPEADAELQAYRKELAEAAVAGALSITAFCEGDEPVAAAHARVAKAVQAMGTVAGEALPPVAIRDVDTKDARRSSWNPALSTWDDLF